MRRALLLGIVLAARVAAGAEIEGVTFADRIVVHGTPFELSTTALLRYRVVFRGYVAALYVAPGAKPESVLAKDAPKRLEIDYFWAIAGADFVKASEEGIAKNLPRDAVARLRPRLDRLNELYVDVSAGDRYALTYLPGRGLELALNGVPRGAPIEGEEFAAAVFAIWFGKEPFDEELKRALLGLS